MSTLHKKQSANLGVNAPRVTSDSPGSKSDQAGGARLDVGLANLTLENSPTAAGQEPIVVRNGQNSPLLKQQLHAVDEQNDTPFQLGKDPEDAAVFASPPKPRTQAPAPAQSNMLGSAMQGAVPTMQPIPMLRTRASDLGNGSGSRSQVGGVDAQAFYPATACVFVANLPDFIRDSRLEAELTRAFSKFGIVFVKIRRDQRNMPFAFCQYTKDEDAHNAVNQGRGILIEGRPCRTEMVKANRNFVIFRVTGDSITVEEARIHMSGFGPMSKCEKLHPQIQEAMRIKDGILVEFTNFDPARDVIAAYRHHPTYRVVAYDLKKSMQTSKMDPDEAWLQRYEVDRRSIYVGNLPVDDPDVEEHLTRLAKEVGTVEKVQVVRKDGRTGRLNAIAFGFIEYSRPDAADLAVKRLNGRALHGNLLRVERKASREPQGTRRFQSEGVFPNATRSPMTGDRIGAQQNRPMAEAPTEPVTPSHAALAETVMPRSASNNGAGSSAPDQGPRIHSYGFVPFGDQNYSSPSYNASPYQANPPAGVGGFPATPQATPGMMSPLGPYYSTPYAWVTPYLQDPNYGSVPYFSGYTSSPLAVAPGTSIDEDAPTPTRHNAGTGERFGDSQGLNE